MGGRPDLRVNTPGDRWEREADQMAAAVVGGGSLTLRRAAGVQRAGGDGHDPAGRPAPEAVHETLAAPGRPLDPDTRSWMEGRFGHDFSSVRIHTDPGAAASARAVDAAAYTVGNHVVFGTGRYRPRTEEGRHLLAHELTHTLQQGAGGPLRVARRGPLPAPPVVRAPTRSGVRVPTGQRYARPPRTLPELAEAMRRRGQVMDAERTVVVLTRGGSPPDFITEHEETGMWEWGTATYTVRYFHILDAIEHDVMQAESQADLIRVLRTFIPGAVPRDDTRIPDLLDVDPRLWGVEFPDGFDPDGEERLRVFWEAFERRNRQLQAEQEAEAEAERRRRTDTEPRQCVASGPMPDLDTDMAYGHCDEHGCEIEPIGQQFGRYPCHADYATSLSGVRREFRITTPEGLSADFDAMDWGGALYEVKTGYRWVPFTTSDPMRMSVVDRFITQSQNQMAVAERCHRTLDWYFNDDQAAAFFEALVQPPVHHVPFDCDRDSDG